MDDHQKINTSLKISKWGKYVTVRRDKIEFINKSNNTTISKGKSQQSVDLKNYERFKLLFEQLKHQI
jgi:hypothetical protein